MRHYIAYVLLQIVFLNAVQSGTHWRHLPAAPVSTEHPNCM